MARAARIRWLAERLTDRGDGRTAIERLLCRVCEAVEYDDGTSAAAA